MGRGFSRERGDHGGLADSGGRGGDRGVARKRDRSGRGKILKPEANIAASSADSEFRRLPPWVWAFGILLFLSSFLSTGYRVYYSNHAHQLPLVYFLNDPELYSTDPFGRTLAAHPSLFWRGVALAARAAPLEVVLLALFVLERALLFAGTVSLARAFAPGSALAAFSGAALAAACISPIIGEGTITREFTEQTGFAVPCYLLAIAMFARRRPTGAAIWFGLGWNLNSLYGVYCASYLIAAFSADRGDWKVWRQWLAAGLLAATIAAPGAFLVFSATTEEPVDSGVWTRVARTFFPYHLYPSAVEPVQWLWLGAFACGAAAALRLGSRGGERRFARHQAAWAIAAAGWIALAGAADAFGIMGLSLVQCLRGPDLWLVLAAAGACAAAAREIEIGAPERRPLWAAALLAMLLFWKARLPSAWLFAIPIAVAAAPALWRGWFAGDHPRRMALAAAATIAAANFIQFAQRAEVAGGAGAALYSGADPAIVDLARWADAETSKDSVFLVHPVVEEFRPVLKRPMFVVLKDAGAIFWHRSFAAEFSKRLEAIGFEFSDPRSAWPETPFYVNELFAAIGDEQVAGLKQRYPIDYWIVPTFLGSNYPTAYENEALRGLDVRVKPRESIDRER